MEFTNTKIKMKNKKITRSEKIQIYYLILIAILIFTLIVAIIVLLKNVDEIKSEPVEYAIEHTDLDWCTCMDESRGEAINYPRQVGEKVELILDKPK